LPSELEALADLAKRRGVSISELMVDLAGEAGAQIVTARHLRNTLLLDLKQGLPQGELHKSGSVPDAAVLAAALKAVCKAK
jgi:hypothetical protein